MNPHLSVLGTGYLGATHAACMAELGFRVVGVDSDPHKVELLSRGIAPFREPGLDLLLRRHVQSGRLRFTTDLDEAARTADVHFVCVGTPQATSGSSGSADLTAVRAVVDALARRLTRPALVVGKSTVPVGTAAELADRLRRHSHPSVRATLAWNPEFLREGHAVADTLRPDRLVFGVDDPGAELQLREIYRQPLAEGVPLHVTDLPTAELSKVAANAFLATKISFVNAVAELSERCGADIVALADVLGDDPRIGRSFLDAGIGFGGGCLPKDIRAFAARAAELGAAGVPALMAEVDAINESARSRTAELALTLCDGTLVGRRVAVLGAAFKPGSDDVRDSPALAVAGRLRRLGAAVAVYDPEASVTARSAAPDLTYVATARAALTGADLVLHLTDWPEFADLDPDEVGGWVRQRRMIDGRNRLDPLRWRAAGWTFHALGRGLVPAPADPGLPTTSSADRMLQPR